MHRLIPGADRLLRRLPLVAALTVLAWIAISGLPWLQRAVLAVAVLALTTLAHVLHARTWYPAEIRLGEPGRLRWRDPSGEWVAAELASDHFISRHYLVIACHGTAARWRFLVSRSMQDPASFEIIRAWIRLLPGDTASR